MIAEKNNLIDMLKGILEMRVTQGITTEAVNKLQEALEATPEYKALQEARGTLNELSEALELQEARYKNEVLFIWDKNKNLPKSLLGVQISQRTKYYYDEPKIISWLKEHGHTHLITEDIDKNKVKALGKALDVDGLNTTLETSSGWAGGVSLTVELEAIKSGGYDELLRELYPEGEAQEDTDE